MPNYSFDTATSIDINTNIDTNTDAKPDAPYFSNASKLMSERIIFEVSSLPNFPAINFLKLCMRQQLANPSTRKKICKSDQVNPFYIRQFKP